MNVRCNAGQILFFLLLLTEFSVAATVNQEANFHRVFDGKDYYTTSTGRKVDFSLHLSTMSSNGKVVAFYGNTYFDYTNHFKLFIHDFESTAEPVEVVLPPSVGSFNSNAGLVSNADGSRIFFTASNPDESYSFFSFYMVNGLTGDLTVLFKTKPPTTEVPQDIATDAAGDYLYFNESDNGDVGHLWRIQTSGGALPEMVLQADAIPHPSGGLGRFIDQFDISDDGETIAFFIDGRIPSDGSPTVRTNKELFVKTDSSIRFLTDNDQNSKGGLVISGDGSTLVYTENYNWMVTTPSATVESQVHIELGYGSCGARPGINSDGSMLLGSSTEVGTSSCNAYLIKTDGSSRRMIEPEQFNLITTYEGYHLSGDASRVFFKTRSYVYPAEWYNMTVGVFDRSLWTNTVPRITNVTYPSDMYSKLENNERFAVNISVSDPQGNDTIDTLKRTMLLPNGYEDTSGAGPVQISPWVPVQIEPSLYTTEGYRGTSWPDSATVMTARFAVEDQAGNVGYTDTLIQLPSPAPSTFTWSMFLPAMLNGDRDK